MIHHTCMDCQRGFIATSREEAQEEYEKLYGDEARMPSFESAVKMNEVAYARYCPYCHSTAIKDT